MDDAAATCGLSGSSPRRVSDSLISGAFAAPRSSGGCRVGKAPTAVRRFARRASVAPIGRLWLAPVPIPIAAPRRHHPMAFDLERNRPSAAPSPSWHALAAGDVMAHLGAPAAGLADAVARERLAREGPNTVRRRPAASAWSILAGQVRSVVVLLLAVAGGLALASGDALDASAIGVVLVINVLLGFVTELRARRAIESLRSLEVLEARVLRDGVTRTIPARDVVRGDVVELEAGEAVPADARLISAIELRAGEAALTGESEPVDKQADVTLEPDTTLADRTNMLYRATTIVAGSARAVVVATGMATEVGSIAALIDEIDGGRTPLERRLDALGRRLVVVAVAAAALVAAVSMFQGAAWRSVLEMGIAVAVAAVPEALPAIVTITMAVGVVRMARRHALVRRLPSVETLGSATVVCTDKTGTLTAGEMTVTTIWLAGTEVRVAGGSLVADGTGGAAGAAHPTQTAALMDALRISALANRAGFAGTGAQRETRGDPTDVALLVLAEKGGLDRAQLSERWPEHGELPFSSERMVMATYHRHPDGHLVAHVKGAPDRVLSRCETELAIEGERPLTPAARSALLAKNDEMARRGLRVLALAQGSTRSVDERDLHALTFVALVGMIDPPAPGVLETIRRLREAGIRTMMLTGDQRLTAEAVGRELGILEGDAESLDAREIDKLSDAALAARLDGIAVCSRITAATKLRIAAALQARGEIIAMLGDGVNDAPALRKADVGVAMGVRGTAVAKEAAAIVLADDRFETIGAAVEEGRAISDNIRKFVFYLLSCNLAEILLLLGVGLAGLPLPLLPLQVLWLNVATDTFPALALAVEPPDHDVMRRPPRHPESALLDRRLTLYAVAFSVAIALAAALAFLWGRSEFPDEPARALTLSFMTLALAQLFHLGNARSPHAVLAPRRMLSNPFALGALFITLLLQFATVSFEVLRRALGTVWLMPREWLVVLLLAAIPAVGGQVAKLMTARRITTRT